MANAVSEKKKGGRAAESFVTRVEVMCTSGGQPTSIAFMIGQPAQDKNPIHFQADYFAKTRNVSVPADFMQFLTDMQKESERTGQNLAALVDDVVQATAQQNKIESASQESPALPDSSGTKNIDDFTDKDDSFGIGK